MTLARGVAIVALCLFVASCDPGGQDHPEVIAEQDVPFQLLETTTTTTEPPVSGTETTFPVYLLGGDRLVSLPRATPGVPTATEVMKTLLEGPTPDEARLGVTSAIPSGTSLRSVARDGDVLTVDLARGFLTKGVDETAAVAQLVWTATELPGIDAARFRVEGKRVQVPTASGALARRPVTRADFP